MLGRNKFLNYSLSLTLLPVCRAPQQQQNLLWAHSLPPEAKGEVSCQRTTNLHVQGLSILHQEVAALVVSVKSIGALQSCKFLSRQHLPFVAEDAVGWSPALT